MLLLFSIRGIKMTEQIDIQKYNELIMKYEYAKKMIEAQLDVIIKDFTQKHGYNPVEHVKGRIKSTESIQKKLERHQKDFTVENIVRYVKDVLGIRIVCSFLSDVFDMVYLISHTKNIIVKERKDYIAEPKDTGYTSYHLQVLVPVYIPERVEYIECEIQIRTVAMDFWASLDHKIAYKFQDSIPDEVKNQMYDYAQIIQELDKKMMDLNTIVQKYKKNF